MASLNDLYSLGTVIAGTLLLGACFSVSPSDGEGSSSSSDSSEGSAAVCIPGETQNCLCLGGQDGVQACNANGSGFEACECPDAGTTTGVEPTTSDTGDSSDGGDTTGSVDGTSTGAGSSTGMGPDHEGPYGPCLEDNTCVFMGEGCATTPEGNICVFVGCRTDADCPPAEQGMTAPPVCVEIDGMGTFGCVLPCATAEDCLPGAECFGGGPMSQGICTWPHNR
ncbi:MAG: hypothetical protein AAF799_01675 [Myxococcota bacterium]